MTTETVRNADGAHNSKSTPAPGMITQRTTRLPSPPKSKLVVSGPPKGIGKHASKQVCEICGGPTPCGCMK